MPNGVVGTTPSTTPEVNPETMTLLQRVIYGVSKAAETLVDAAKVGGSSDVLLPCLGCSIEMQKMRESGELTTKKEVYY